MPVHRHVFFIAGFDPKSPRHYHRLFKALAQQRPCPPTGPDAGSVTVLERVSSNATADRWELRWTDADGAEWVSAMTQLRWDDIVRQHWGRSLRSVWRDHWNFYVDGWRQGNFGRVWRSSRVNWLFVMYPLGVTLACLAAAWAGLAWLAAAWAPSPAAALPPWLAVPLAGALGVAPAWWLWRRVAHRLGADWLLRLYGFSHAQAEGRVAGLDERLDAMAEQVARALSEPGGAAEVLVVGHSVGATLAASALARALRRVSGAVSVTAPGGASHGAQVALLSLGHCTPLVYFHRTAGRWRDELDGLVDHAQLTWVDYTAPADWAACGRMSPWHRPGQALLHRLSPRFPRILRPERYRALRRNRLAMHMQYLKPADHAGGYDLLALTAGPLVLRERHPPPAHLAAP